MRNNKTKPLKNTLSSLLVLWALSWCAILTEQTSSNMNSIMEKDNLWLQTKIEVIMNNKLSPEEFNRLRIKKRDSVLVLYIDKKWNKYITQEQFSEKQLEYPMVRYIKEYKVKKDWEFAINFDKIFIAPNWEEFDNKEVLLSWDKITIVS